ncbi:EAL domain-containing protein [Hahella sp. HN01]|uniref:EAL domain-containing protein n=1 Tax=Hahella sp. HN01 TaxID=2847262 RepID=UPI001C1EA583|nr:EAL domain-containing protein [Hahella sp. HN01]MBU6953900.1 EAL domain-containing protein [Hahella sp. HN01]
MPKNTRNSGRLRQPQAHAGPRSDKVLPSGRRAVKGPFLAVPHEARFQYILDDIPELICRWKPDGAITYVNSQYCRYFGSSRNALIGKSIFTLSPAEERNVIHEQMRRITQSSPVSQQERKVIDGNGAQRWLLWTDRGIFDSQGRLLEFQSIGRDITDSRETNEQIGSMASLATLSPHPIMRATRDGAIIYVNYAAAEFLKLWGTAIGDHIPSTWAATLKKVMGSGKTAMLELERNGRHFLLTLSCDRSASSQEKVANLYVTDISKQKQNEDALRRSENRLGALVSAEADSILVIDDAGVIRFANPAAERIFGKPKEMLIGQSFGAPCLIGDYAEVEFPRGGKRIAEMRAQPVPWNDIQAHLITLHDVTDHRKREHLLQRRNRTLAVLTACDHHLVRESDERRLIDSFCRQLVGVGRHQTAWFGWVDDGRLDTSSKVILAGDETPFTLMKERHRLALDENDPVIRALREDCSVTQHDLSELYGLPPNSNSQPLSQCMIALPVGKSPETLGIMVIYSEYAEAFDHEEIELLEQLADDLYYGVVSLRTRHAREKAEESLRLRDRAVESTPNGILILNARRPDLPLVYVNPAFERITGYSSGEVVGKGPFFLQSDIDEDRRRESLHFLIRNREEGCVLLRNQRKDGSQFWNELHIAPVYDDRRMLTHFVAVINDVTESRHYQEQLEYQASHDDLTGLPNRNMMRDRLGQELWRAARNKHKVAIVFLDVDQFKLINDSLGHNAGDAMLKVIAKRLTGMARASDTVVRYGGDEFVIILPDISPPEKVASFISRLMDVIAQPIQLDHRDIRVSASIGVSIYPQDGDHPEVLIKNADIAMYLAKEEGRNRFHFFTEDLNKTAMERLDLEVRLRAALEKQQFHLEYQPQVDLRSGVITGVEALLRWHEPELGDIPPGKFIPIAEETGLIGAIGEWVLHAACVQAKAWTDLVPHPLTMSINLSAKQLTMARFDSALHSILTDTGVDCRHIEIELTESAIMRNVDEMRERLNLLKEQRLKLAVDDFGVGYSSFSHLRSFSFDRLKLDITFVRDITTDPNTASIARTVMSMARSMHMQVVAEGIETEAQLRYLQRLGCDVGQGFFLGRPACAQNIEALLASPRIRSVRPPPSTAARNLLVLDDEMNVGSAIKRLLRHQFNVFHATTSRQAFDIMARTPIQVVISDQRMPDMSGTEFLNRVKELHPNAIRLILTGYVDMETITEAVNKGWIFKFLTKPWQDDKLLQVVTEAFEQYEKEHQTRLLDTASGVSDAARA